MQLVPTTDGAAPAPRPIRAVERWRVAWHGRRDAQRPPADPDQPPPYLESLRAHAEISRRAVNGWLHGKIDPIDHEAVQVLILLDQHRREQVMPPEVAPVKPAAQDAEPQPLSSIPPRVLEAREAAAARKAYQRWVREQKEAEQRLGQLFSTRHHLIALAREAANAHVARYEHLVKIYHTALRRRCSDPHRTGPPPAVSTEPWPESDLPILVLEIDGRDAERYHWRLRDFLSRTPALTLPARDVTDETEPRTGE
ncbi:MAG: hypothetical protein JO063_08450 [Pseudonocardiales bacterium]|nr:hypothetical protein [Pseudonocardiales bacterium]MBV9028876.1 hypothetical protein [Pseudonocardiales bacterium]MBW0010133.1 hypothetical protein [Pseudonocardiales bacterium]